MFVFLSMAPLRAIATSTELEYKQSSQSSSPSAAFSGDFKKMMENTAEDGKKLSLNWNLFYSQDKSNVTDPNTNIAITDNTQSVTAGLGVETPEHFFFELDDNYSVTPEEQLDAVGASFNSGYRYYFAAPQEEFAPSIKVSVQYGVTNNNQSFKSATVPRRRNVAAKPIFGNNIIVQTVSSVSLSVNPIPWMSLKGSYSKYEYNRDVNSFLQFIESPRLVKVSNGISNALSGFYLFNWKVESDFYFYKIWEIDLLHSVSKVATDSSYSTENDVTVLVEIGQSWQVGLGVEMMSSTAVDSSNSTTSVGKLNYSF